MDWSVRSLDQAIAQCAVLSEAFANTPSRTFVEGADLSAFCEEDGNALAGVRAVRDCVAALGDDGYRDIKADYCAICCGTSAYSPIPYQSIYADDERLLMRDCCKEVASLYGDFGFSFEGGPSNEPADYLPTILGCLAFLYRAAKDAQQNGDEDACALSLERAAGFKEKHLRSWVGSYCREARALARTDYYKGMLQLLDAFALAD